MAEMWEKESQDQDQARARLLAECVRYFQSRPVYQRLFADFREKYASLGRFAGCVTLKRLAKEERVQLGGFLQKDYMGLDQARISAWQMEKALAASRFAALAWEEILEAYFEEPLMVKREEQRKRDTEREKFFLRVLQEHADDKTAVAWLEEVLAKHLEGYQFLMRRHREDPAALWELLHQVLEAIEHLPGQSCRMLLPVFAAEQTGNPHYFDAGTPGERLLSAFLHFSLHDTVEEAASAAEQQNRLFFEAGILRDDLSNDVLAYGIRGVRADGTLHEGMEGFFRQKEPMRLTLRTLGGLQSASGTPRIYIVENPAVFSTLVLEHPELSVICGNGQPRIAVLVLLDLLSAGSMFYYAGDFDAEGLLIAQRLKNRYPDRLTLWGCQAEWYLRHLSGVRQDEARLCKLEQVTALELQELRAAMQEQKQAAYQEQMLSELLESLRRIEGQESLRFHSGKTSAHNALRKEL